MFVSHEARLEVGFEVALAELAALAGSGMLTRVSAGVYRAGSGEGRHRVAAMAPGGFLDRIAETITRAGTAIG